MKNILMLIVFLFFGITIQYADACSCVKKDSLEEAYSKADIVVQGVVVRSELVHLSDSIAISELIESGTPLDSIDKYLTDLPMAKVYVEIETVYKGKISQETLIIYTGSNDGNCGFRFSVGRYYIIYGNRESYLRESFNERFLPNMNEFYWTYICTRTEEYNYGEILSIEEYVKKLEK